MARMNMVVTLLCDHGLTKASEVKEWMSDKVFRVGDKICKSCDRSLYDEKREKERELWERRHYEREESDKTDFF